MCGEDTDGGLVCQGVFGKTICVEKALPLFPMTDSEGESF
jgi:hypothetical protein